MPRIEIKWIKPNLQLSQGPCFWGSYIHVRAKVWIFHSSRIALKTRPWNFQSSMGVIGNAE